MRMCPKCMCPKSNVKNRNQLPSQYLTYRIRGHNDSIHFLSLVTVTWLCEPLSHHIRAENRKVFNRITSRDEGSSAKRDMHGFHYKTTQDCKSARPLGYQLWASLPLLTNDRCQTFLSNSLLTGGLEVTVLQTINIFNIKRTPPYLPL